VNAAALALAVCLQASPQQPEPLFTVRAAAAAPGAVPRQLVAADRRLVDCLTTLRGLCAAVGWSLAIESDPLQNDLAFQSVDLNLADQEPRLVAQLVATAAGADVVFDEAATIEGARPTLHVVRRPDASTESGRQRLRSLAGQWYRSFLRDELQHEPLVDEQGVQVRMNLGQVLVDSGDLESAIGFFTAAFDRRPHDSAAAAVLRIAECHLDLARGQADRAAQLAHCQEAERWARRVFENMPSAPRRRRRRSCSAGRCWARRAPNRPSRRRAGAPRPARRNCARGSMRLVDSVEMLDVWLLAAEAHVLLGQPAKVHETMLTLRESPYFDELSPRQFLDYHWLLGFGAIGVQKTDLAMRALEWFLIHAENDPRRGTAHVLLAEAYLAERRLLQARAASVEARLRHLGTMTPDWRRRALEVWARSALALGDRESAFLELEQMIARGEEPELALFVADQMIADRQWERAIAVVRGLLDLDAPAGDQARFKKVQALYEQASAGGHLEDFPPLAIALAPRIGDPGLRGRTATLIGDAYARLGRVEHAADAYRGILR